MDLLPGLHPAMKHPVLLILFTVGLVQTASVALAQDLSYRPPPFYFPSFIYTSPPPPVYVPKRLPQYALLAFILILMAGLCLLICIVKTKRMCMDRQSQQQGLMNQGTPLVAQGDAATQTTGLLRQSQGLDPAVVQALPLFSYRKVGIPEAVGIKGHGDCPVCLSEFSDGDNVRLLPNCKHVFHRECIDMWLLSHPSCPLCREAVQVQKQTSLRKILTLLRGRSVREDLQEGQQQEEAPQEGSGHQPRPLEVVAERPPDSSSFSTPTVAAVSEERSSSPATPPPLPQLSDTNGSSTRNDVEEGGNPSTNSSSAPGDESGRSERQSAAMLGGSRGIRRPPSEDIRWAMSDMLATTTPRVVKRSASLGRDLATPRPRLSAEDRRHSFGEMLRRSFKRDASFAASLPAPCESPAAAVSAPIRVTSSSTNIREEGDIEAGGS